MFFSVCLFRKFYHKLLLLFIINFLDRDLMRGIDVGEVGGGEMKKKWWEQKGEGGGDLGEKGGRGRRSHKPKKRFR